LSNVIIINVRVRCKGKDSDKGETGCGWDFEEEWEVSVGQCEMRIRPRMEWKIREDLYYDGPQSRIDLRPVNVLPSTSVSDQLT
jgi:hypothetical protein